MSKLLRAGFYRLKKDKVFTVALVVFFLFTALMTAQSIGSYKGSLSRGFESTMESYYFSQSLIVGGLYAVFTCLFLGVEYSDGTLRNKLCVGHSRKRVYMTYFYTSLIANISFYLLWMVCCSPMFFLIGSPAMGMKQFFAYVGVGLCFTISFTALFVMIAATVTNKAYSLVVALGVWIVLLMIAAALYDRLHELPTNGGMAYVDGEFVMIEATPNPLYVAGTARVILECVLEFLPTGQGALMNNLEIAHPVRQMLFSLLLTLICLWGGLRLFRKKDIR